MQPQGWLMTRDSLVHAEMVQVSQFVFAPAGGGKTREAASSMTLFAWACQYNAPNVSKKPIYRLCLSPLGS